jgi:hypothetical protein
METMTVLLAFVVSLVLIYIAWQAAKRDLSAAAVREQSPSLSEMRELRETLEGLIAVLEEKASEIEGRLNRQFDRLEVIEQARADVHRSEPATVFGQASSFASDLPDDAEPTVLGRAFELLAEGNDAREGAAIRTKIVIEHSLRRRGVIHLNS